MAEAPKKSKKRSGGKPSARQRLRESHVFFLDENFSRCQPLVQVLQEAKLSSELYHSHFKPGEDDDIWLAVVGPPGWIVITKDKAQRYTPLEKAQVIKHKIREFSFSSGNLNRDEMAEILKLNLRKILKFLEKHPAPFIVSMSRNGIRLRFPPPD